MLVEIKQIVQDEKDDTFLLIRCCKPHQKQTPLSKGQEELDRNNKLFEEYAEQHKLRISEYQKQILQLHLGEAILTQDGKTT